MIHASGANAFLIRPLAEGGQIGFHWSPDGAGAKRQERARRTGVASFAGSRSRNPNKKAAAHPQRPSRKCNVPPIALNQPATPFVGMLAYSSFVVLYLGYVGLAGEFVGVFLWPAVVLHAILSILLGHALWAAEASSK